MGYDLFSLNNQTNETNQGIEDTEYTNRETGQDAEAGRDQGARLAYRPYLHRNLSGWHTSLRLAQQYGWQPLGTVAPKEEGADGSLIPGDEEGERMMGYGSNDGQRVLAQDAAALAEALERALGDVPDDTTALERKQAHCVKQENLRPAPSGVVPPDATPLELFSGEKGKESLRELIAFCRQGSFLIG